MKKNIVTVIFILVSFLPGTSFADLIGQYSFSGNAEDSSGYENDGTVYGATLTEDRFGNANSAYDFDGVDDYISIGYLSSMSELSPTDSISISVWVKADQYGNSKSGSYVGGIVASQYDYEETGYSVMMDFRASAHGGVQGGVHFQLGEGNDNGVLGDDWWTTNTQGTTNTAILLDDWTHIVVVATAGSVYKVYLNGELVANWIAGDNIAYGSMNQLLIGDNANGASSWSSDQRYFDGVIDDINIFDHALTEVEIQNLYNPVPEPATLLLLGVGLAGLGGLRKRLYKK